MAKLDAKFLSDEQMYYSYEREMWVTGTHDEDNSDYLRVAVRPAYLSLKGWVIDFDRVRVYVYCFEDTFTELDVEEPIDGKIAVGLHEDIRFYKDGKLLLSWENRTGEIITLDLIE